MTEPIVSTTLTPAQLEQISAWMQSHGIRELCPMCDRAAPLSQELIYAYDGRVSADRAYFSKYITCELERICTFCGYTTHWNAEVLGLTPPDDVFNRVAEIMLGYRPAV